MSVARLQIVPSISPQSEVKISMVPADYIDGMWAIVEPCLLRSYRSTDQTIPVKLRDDLRGGHRQLWLVTQGDVTILAAGITSITAMRSGLALKIEQLGSSGSRRISAEHWVHLFRNTMEAYARDCGCKKIRGEGRLGWKRLFPDYRVSGIMMEKRLDRDEQR